MNDRSATTRSKPLDRPQAVERIVRQRARIEALERWSTRGSAARRGCELAAADVDADDARRAPRCSSTSVKPPVLWPRSRQVMPATSMPQCAPARRRASDPPRETKRSSASSVISSVVQSSAGPRPTCAAPPSRPARASARAPVRDQRAARPIVSAPGRAATSSWSARITPRRLCRSLTTRPHRRSVAVGVGLVRARSSSTPM